MAVLSAYFLAVALLKESASKRILARIRTDSHATDGVEPQPELDNATVHAGLHFGKVPLPDGGFGVQMVIYVKPKGTLGKLYMAGIKPFRHWIVYPALLRHMERSLG